MSLAERIADLFFVPKCIICSAVIERPGICIKCQGELAEAAKPVRGVEFLEEVRAAYIYEGALRDAVHRFKFGGKKSYAAVMGDRMLPLLERLEARPQVISWVPTSAERLRKRGYDQAQVLAEYIAGRAGLPCRRLLTRRRSGKQSNLGNKAARVANAAGAFRTAEDVSGLSILLVDDVVTTGATLSECARVLLTEGASEVRACAFACVKGIVK